MQQILANYPQSGSFLFSLGSSLRNVCNAPNLPGVYLIYSFNSDGEEILKYIGKGGSIKTNGSWKSQMLIGRINASRGNPMVSAQTYFTNKVQQENLTQIKFRWYVTFNNNISDIPGFVEGLLIQEYFRVNGSLPDWNNCF